MKQISPKIVSGKFRDFFIGLFMHIKHHKLRGGINENEMDEL